MSLLRKLFIGCPKTPSTEASGHTTGHKADTDAEKKKKKKQKHSAESKTDANCCSSETEDDEESGSQKDEAECAVCQDKVSEPCTIPCGNHHVFCLACLKGLVAHNTAHRNHFLCPLCRKRVRIPIGGVAAFRNHKTFGQKLRSKLPALRPPRSRHRRRHRSGLRSTDYLTVSFPMLAYPDQLELDLLTTLYAHREGPSGRLVEAILDEINNRQGHPARDDDGAMWISEDLDPSDSDEEEDLDSSPAAAAVGMGRLSSSSGNLPGVVNVEDLDMSVVLQIIADMEENDRRREGAGQATLCRASAATGGAAAAASGERWEGGCGAAQPQVAQGGSDRSQRLETVHVSQRSKSGNAGLQSPVESGNTTAQTTETAITTHRSETDNTSQRPETGNTSQSPKTGSTSQSPKTGNTTLQGLAAGSAASQRPESSHAKSQRPEIGTSRGAESDRVTRQRSRSTGTASAKPGAGSSATPKKLSNTAIAPSRRPDTHMSSSQRSSERSTSERSAGSNKASVFGASSSSPSRQNNDSVRTENSAPSSTNSQRSNGHVKGAATGRSSTPPQQSPSAASAGGSAKDHSPFNGKLDTVSEGKDTGLSDCTFLPRPRMGSFKLAIDAGQRTPTSDEDSPPLFTLPQDQEPAPDTGIINDSVHSSDQRSILSKSQHTTKTDIEERPFRIRYHAKQTKGSDPCYALEKSREERLVRMMDSAERDSEEQVIAMMDRLDRHPPLQEQRMGTTSTATCDDSTTGRLHQKDRRLHDFGYNKDMTKMRSTKEDILVSRQSDPPEGISQASHPDPQFHALHARDGRRAEQSPDQTSSFALATSDGFRSKQRRLQERGNELRWAIPSSSELQKRPNTKQGAMPGHECLEDVLHSNQRACGEKDPEDSDEWTRRIRDLQRRVISQTRNRMSRDAHRLPAAQGPAVASHTRHSYTSPSPQSANDDDDDDDVFVMDTQNTGVGVFHV